MGNSWLSLMGCPSALRKTRGITARMYLAIIGGNQWLSVRIYMDLHRFPMVATSYNRSHMPLYGHSPSLNWMSIFPVPARFARTVTVSQPRFVCTRTRSPTCIWGHLRTLKDVSERKYELSCCDRLMQHLYGYNF